MATTERPFLQLIDDQSTFSDQLIEFLHSEKLIDCGLGYSVVAVVGSQSTGKSTLLNHLFGTAFPILDAHKGRHRVTEGICLSRATDANILVLDLEGTDSTERSEDETGFERKIALFSLSIAEVLILNMWYSDVGRRNAANYPLLRTVFEINLQLFHQKDANCRTALLFVIRDHEDTEFDEMYSSLKRDVEVIWASVSKPVGLESSRVDDFFDIRLALLPNKKYRSDDFCTEVTKLKDRFLNKENSAFLFSQLYKRNIPIDGFPEYARSNWGIISSNKDLDIPSQKELLSEKRCHDIRMEIFSTFQSRVAADPVIVACTRGEPPQTSKSQDGSSLASSSSVSEFSLRTSAFLDDAVAEFQSRASLYSKSAFHKHLDELRSSIHDELHSKWKEMMDAVLNRSLTGFNAALQEIAATIAPGLQPNNGNNNSSSRRSNPTFGLDRIRTLVESTYRDYFQSLHHCRWTDESGVVVDWVNRFRDTVGRAVEDGVLGAVRQSAIDALERQYEDQYAEKISQCLAQCSPQMWTDIRSKKIHSIQSFQDSLKIVRLALAPVFEVIGWSTSGGATARRSPSKFEITLLNGSPLLGSSTTSAIPTTTTSFPPDSVLFGRERSRVDLITSGHRFVQLVRANLNNQALASLQHHMEKRFSKSFQRAHMLSQPSSVAGFLASFTRGTTSSSISVLEREFLAARADALSLLDLCFYMRLDDTEDSVHIRWNRRSSSSTTETLSTDGGGGGGGSSSSSSAASHPSLSSSSSSSSTSFSSLLSGGGDISHLTAAGACSVLDDLVLQFPRGKPSSGSGGVGVGDNDDDFKEGKSSSAVHFEDCAEFAVDHVIMGPARCEEVFRQFLKFCDLELREAYRMQTQNQSKTHIPPVLLVMLAVLGFDEFVAIFTSPLYFTLTIGLGAIYLFLRFRSLTGDVLGNLSFLRATAGPIVATLTDLIAGQRNTRPRSANDNSGGTTSTASTVRSVSSSSTNNHSPMIAGGGVGGGVGSVTRRGGGGRGGATESSSAGNSKLD